MASFVPDARGESRSTGAGFEALYEKLEIRGNVLGYALFQDIEESDLNVFNVLGIPDRMYEITLRPDFYLPFEEKRLTFEFKPRFAANETGWDDGIYQYKSNERDSETYVNEWLIRWGLTDRLFLSGGRENLQWGPSYLLSPSNPFLRDNGKNNPYLELPGLDYVRSVWIPNEVWSLSLIANVGKGRSEPFEDFQNTYGIKLDFTGSEKYAGLIASQREQDEVEFGFFGGLTLTDYLLVYSEGNLSLEENSTDILAGISYTLPDGSALALEYFHQGSGCDTEPIEDCVVPEGLYEEIEQHFDGFSGTIDDLLRELESLDLEFDRPTLIRKNYVMLQYAKPRIREVLTLTGRWIYDVDDVSSRLVGMANWDINSRFTLLTVGNVLTGGTDTEFGCLLNHSLMVGLTYNF